MLLSVTPAAGAQLPADVAVGPSSPTCIARERPPAAGAHEISEHRDPDDPRRLEVWLHSDAMVGETRYGEPGLQPVKVLLPTNYDPSGATRYPVLYNLHGFTGAAGFGDDIELEKDTDGLDVIVVSPDGGFQGGYLDWYGRVPGDSPGTEPPAWETYHMKELIPFIDSRFPTIAAREGRAIVGISMGGNGSMKYAARHPDLFAAAGALSGAVDVTADFPIYGSVSFFGLSPLGTLLGLGAGELDPPTQCASGDPYTQQIHWEDNNPFYLASNLKGVDLWLSNGTGGDGTEDYIARMNQWFRMALDDAGITCTDMNTDPTPTPCTYTITQGGAHNVDNWIPNLKRFIPWVMDRFAAPSRSPAAFSYRGMSKDLEAWDWTFEGDTRRVAKEFTYTDDVSRDGFTISGSGHAVHVTTAALYPPGKPYIVDGTGATPIAIRAGKDHRLSFDVDLGDPHLVQQYRFRCLCWGDLDNRSGPPGPPSPVTVAPFGNDPEMRSGWVTRHVHITPTPGAPL